MHIGTILGRVFLIGSPSFLKKWKGATEDTSEVSHYDSLNGYINFEDAGISVFNNQEDSCLIFFSMSSKMEVYKEENKIILSEGLYFNQSWDYTKNLTFSETNEALAEFIFNEGKVIIVDAVVNGSEINSEQEGVFTTLNNIDKFCVISVEKGSYSVEKGKVDIAKGDKIIAVPCIVLAG